MDIQKEKEAFEAWYCRNHTGLKQSDLAKFRTLSGYSFSDSLKINISWEAWQAAKAQAVPEGFVVCKSEPVAYIVQNKFWKQKFDVKNVKDMPPQKWEDDHYDVEIPLYAVSLDGLVLKEQDEDEAND